MKKENPLIIALNTHSPEQAFKWIDELTPEVSIFKVGIPLFLQGGLSFIKELHKRNLRIFLDLKFHDIPSVVSLAVQSAGGMGVEFLTIHTLGGFDMLESSAKAAWELEEITGNRPKLIGVTILTSMAEAALQDVVGIRAHSPETEAGILARMAKSAGLDGVVSSVYEVRRIKEICGENFITITPGIRLETDERDDQERVATPDFAIKEGADYLVVGRPITHSPNPREALKKYLFRIYS